MQSLSLTVPEHPRLEKNAHAPILAILKTVDDIRTECASFTATNDTRAAVSKLYEALGAQVEALADVNGHDLEAEKLGADHTAALNLFRGAVRNVGNKLRYVSSTEEGTKLPQRRMRAAFAAVKSAVESFSEHHDTRPAAVTAIEAMRAAIADVLLLDHTLDRWYAEQVYQSCDSLLTVFAMPIPLPDAPVASAHPDQKRFKAADAAYEMLTRVRSIGYNYHSTVDEAAPLAVRVAAVRAQLLEDFFSPLVDVASMIAEIRAIKASLPQLLNVHIPERTGSPNVLRKSVGDAQEAGDALLLILDPKSTPQFTSAPSMLEQLRTKLLPAANWGWNDRSTEGVTE